MADGWDPGRLGEPGQRPAPRLNLSPPTFLSTSPSLYRPGVCGGEPSHRASGKDMMRQSGEGSRKKLHERQPCLFISQKVR